MTRLQHTAVIERPLRDTYRLAQQVERYPEFLPGYLESRIIERQGERLLLQRKALVEGEIKEWKSWASFLDSQTIVFEHAEGPLKGMTVTWEFNALSPNSTELAITHLFETDHYKPAIDHLANLVINAFKTACECKLA